MRKVKGAIFIGIIITALIGAIPYFGQSHLPSGSWIGVPAWGDWTSLVLGKLDVLGALNLGLFTVVFAFLFVDMFDTLGTLIGVADQGGFLDEKGELPRIDKAMLVDSVGTIVGSVFGTSTVTSYIESAAGVAAGGRTGFTAVVVGILFILVLVLPAHTERYTSGCHVSCSSHRRYYDDEGRYEDQVGRLPRGYPCVPRHSDHAVD